MLRSLISVLALAVLVACSPSGKDLEKPAVPLGDFQLSHNIVVAPKTQKVPGSRELPKEKLIAEVTKAIDARFRRYEGDRLYHFGISIESYLLAPPGIPIVANPKSAMIIRLTVWDDAEQKKLNEKFKQFVIVESLSDKTLVGSGLTQSKEEQLENLARSAAKQIENYLVSQKAEEGWFEGSSDAVATE